MAVPKRKTSISKKKMRRSHHRILGVNIIEDKNGINQLVAKGYDKDLIIKIIRLIKKAEFKRKQAPPILKLSKQSLGNDWRIPIAISKI